MRSLDHLAGSRTYVSYVALGEVYEHAFRHANPQAHLVSFRNFLGFYGLLGLDDPIMERFAERRAFLRRRGEGLADLDLLIAATALHHNLTLLTFDLRHFARVPELKLYQPG